MAASLQIHPTSLEKMDKNSPHSSISIEEGSETQQCTLSEGATPFSVQQDATSGGATPLTMTNRELHEGFLQTSLTDVIDHLLAQGKRVMILVIDMSYYFNNYKFILDFVAKLPQEYIDNPQLLQTMPTKELRERLQAVGYEGYQSANPYELPKLDEINQFSDLFSMGNEKHARYVILNIALLVKRYKDKENVFLLECVYYAKKELLLLALYFNEIFPIDRYYALNKYHYNINSALCDIYHGGKNMRKCHFTQILEKLYIDSVVINGYSSNVCVFQSTVGTLDEYILTNKYNGKTIKDIIKEIHLTSIELRKIFLEEWILTHIYGIMSKKTVFTSYSTITTESILSDIYSWPETSSSVYASSFNPLELSLPTSTELPQCINTDEHRSMIPKLIEQSSIADEQVHLLLQEASKKITQKIVDVLLRNGIDLYNDKDIPDISEEKDQEISCIVYREIKENLDYIDKILHKIETSDVPVTELIPPSMLSVTSELQQQSNEANNDVCTESMEVNTYSPEPMEETPSVLVSTGTYTGLIPPHSKKLTVSPAEGGKPISIANSNDVFPESMEVNTYSPEPMEDTTKVVNDIVR